MSWRVFKAVNHFKRELLQKRKKCNLLYFIPAKLSLNEVSLKAKSGWNFTQNSLIHTLHVPTLLNGNVQRSWKVLPTLWDYARPIFPWPGICNVPNILNGLICFPSNSSFFFHFFHLHFFSGLNTRMSGIWPCTRLETFLVSCALPLMTHNY